jgi:hypothetical protein
MTSSSDWGEVLDLDRDLPTTAEDIAVLNRLRYGRRLTFDQYLECLAALDAPSAARLRRPVPGGAPFHLIARPSEIPARSSEP